MRRLAARERGAEPAGFGAMRAETAVPYSYTFVQDFSLGGLPSSAVRRGVTAANGMESLFGPDWIQRVYPSQKGPVLLRRAIAQWDQ